MGRVWFEIGTFWKCCASPTLRTLRQRKESDGRERGGKRDAERFA